MIYVRGEYQYGSASQEYTPAQAQYIADSDQLPLNSVPTFQQTSRPRLVEVYAGLNLADWQFTFGQQSLWWGVNRSTSILFSNNAQALPMLRVERVSPMRVPLLGPVNVSGFLARMGGTKYLRLGPDFAQYGDGIHNVDPQPFLWGANIAFKPTANLDAYDYYLQGLAKVYQSTKHANDDALRLFHKAIELDANFASAYGMAAWCYAWRKRSGWIADRANETAAAALLARQAVELGKDDAVALGMGGFALALVVGEVEDGAAFIDEALILNPNLALGWLLSGWVNIYLGNPEVAIERAMRAVRLSPLDPFTFLAFSQIGAGHFYAGRYDEASSWAEKGLRQQPNSAGTARVAAASHALAGRVDQAQKAMARLREMDPTLRVSDLRQMVPFRRPQDLARFEEGLRKAGLPE